MSGQPKREGKSKESSLAAPEAEVEALLRAAQDDLLLKLRVDSHPISSRPSSSALDSDLALRFDALKSAPPSRSTAAPPSPPLPLKPERKGATAAAYDEEWGRFLGDDLAARFAALKSSSSRPNPGIRQPDLMTPNLGDSDDEAGAAGGGGDGVSEKEVEKVMQWAMDAARLDPSKGDGLDPSKGDGDVDDDDNDGESTDDDDEEEDVNEKKRKEINKGKPRKKFFFF